MNLEAGKGPSFVMENMFVQIAAIISAILLAGIAIFQWLLLAGLPLGQYSWGGKFRGVLPPLLRMISVPSSLLLLLMALVFLMRANVISVTIGFLPVHSLAWIFTVFLGLNTMGNLASKSKEEKTVMAPVSGLAFLSGLLVSIYSV